MDTFATARIFYERAGATWEIRCDGEVAGPGLPEPWAVLTAWNPEARPRSEAWNRAAQARLLADLSPFAPLRALGASPDLVHREPSLLVQMSVEEALAHARRFRQLAIFAAEGGVVRVVSTGAEPSRSMGPYHLVPAPGLGIGLSSGCARAS
jgi:hypothetical protein